MVLRNAGICLFRSISQTWAGIPPRAARKTGMKKNTKNHDTEDADKKQPGDAIEEVDPGNLFKAQGCMGVVLRFIFGLFTV